MTPAELLVARLACGQSVDWLADVCGVDRRTAQRWQSPTRWQDVPEAAAKAVRSELDLIAEMTDHACAVVADNPADRRTITIRPGEPRTIAVAWRVLERIPDCAIDFGR